MDEVLIYTDGAARNNPGRGGYGAILKFGNKQKEISQGYKLTTNNRMELMAVIAALQALKKNNLNITIFSDSEYVVNAVMKGWLNNWIKKKFAKKKNKDLWMQYHKLSLQHQIKFVWVKGHSTNIFNNRCDVLATAAADGNNLIDDVGFSLADEKNTDLFD